MDGSLRTHGIGTCKPDFPLPGRFRHLRPSNRQKLNKDGQKSTFLDRQVGDGFDDFKTAGKGRRCWIFDGLTV
jgi:hypothetical protein